MTDRRILVTAALPYANGQIHIGHLVEYIQTDIWVRFQKLRGNRTVFFCADDTHGTAISIRARAEGRTEEEVIAEMSDAHQRDFAAFGIEFDNYGSGNRFATPGWSRKRTSSSCSTRKRACFWQIASCGEPVQTQTATLQTSRATIAAGAEELIRLRNSSTQ